MKKITLKLALLAALVVAFASCKEEPVYELSLQPTELEMTFGQQKDITPIENEALKEESLQFKWISSNEDVATAEHDKLGRGVGVVTAKRVGEATITYTSLDKKIKISKSVSVVVKPRNLLLNDFFFENGASKSKIQLKYHKLNQAESTDKLLVYEDTRDELVPKLIYSLDNNEKINALYIILSGKERATALDAKNYLEERFVNTVNPKDGILFYKNVTFNERSTFPLNTAAGIFTNLEIGEKNI